MDTLGPQSFWIISLILGSVVGAPTLLSLFVLTNQRKAAPRLNPSLMGSEDIKVTFKIKDKCFSFPIQDISRTGMAFRISKLPESFVLEQKLPLKVYVGEKKEYSFDLDSQLVYIRADDFLNNYKVGVKFNHPITNETLFEIIDSKNRLRYLTEGVFAEPNEAEFGGNVTQLKPRTSEADSYKKAS